MTRLNHELLRTRRLELGISTTEVISVINTNAHILNALENGEQLNAHFPAERLLRWCNILGLNPADIWDTPPATPTPDTATLGAFLGNVGRALQPDTIADSLQWEPQRVEQALTDLANLAPHIGHQLTQRLNGGYTLTPTTNNTITESTIRAARKHADQYKVSGHHIRKLWQVAFTDMNTRALSLTATDRTALGGITSRQLVTRTPGETRPELASHVAYSLAIGELD